VKIDLHCCCHTSHKLDAIRHLIDMDVHGHALRKAHPGEDRIDRGESHLIRLRIRDIDAASNAVDMSADDLAVAHQLDGRLVAFPDAPEAALLEIAVDPEGVGVDDRDDPLKLVT